MKQMERYINHWSCISTPEGVMQIGCLSIKLSSNSFYASWNWHMCDMPLNKSVNHDGGKHVWRHWRRFPCKHASYWLKSQEHDGLKVKREGKRKSENIKGVHPLVSTKDSTSDCNLWWTLGPQQKKLMNKTSWRNSLW